MDAAALIVAGGRGVRAGGGMAKQYRQVGGMAVLRRAVLAFLGHPRVGCVRVVIHPDDGDLYREAVDRLELLAPVFGGATRQDSARLGLESLGEHAPAQVLIHDAARPFVAPEVVSRVLDALAAFPGAIPALPVVDTLKRSGVGAPGRPLVAATVERAGLWRAQTPQGFHFRPILEAHRRLAGEALTDDAAVAERAGLAVALVEGDEDNVKLTTAEDFRRAERQAGTCETRVGTGFDVHRFAPGSAVMLCGVAVPHDRGLEGHSDADVGLHALTDALLGAIGAGDIGSHFPPGELEWRGAASHLFVRHAMELLRGQGGAVVNADITLICERPKVGPHRAAMVAAVAAMLGIDAHRVSVKATTTEGLGFTGRREGVAAQAAVSVRLPQR
ncbi:MAG: bifunctional 2-C-methyl-D-erythritol 4-phosphate cytidylyltransferase/2-C-methyl-D-erythritol 2,4-cyclodiphosphate synthase [Rhodospirillales bacterium]|nr:bifunctional 2-C-methyl-D-erythritol 4-phosphate cytidylyltransferase/2-C-methyl-D-erythritol 2,4-cyclodiphosphate synthase [Rhodospirillales bacterium]